MLEKIKTINAKINTALIMYLDYMDKHSHEWKEQDKVIAHDYLSHLHFETVSLYIVQSEYKEGDTSFNYLKHYQRAVVDYLKNSYPHKPDDDSYTLTIKEYLGENFDFTQIYNQMEDVSDDIPSINLNDFLVILNNIEKKADIIIESLKKL